MTNIISIQSHVVFGHAGNSSAVFPMQRMGVEVWPIHTVQFSNHTQYQQGWTGRAFDSSDITELMSGVDKIGQLENCSALLSGYQGSASQCDSVVSAVSKLKERNSKAIYVCDPVMGDPEKGCIVADDVTDKLVNDLMPIADVIVPNQFELTQFTDMPIETLQDAVAACQYALSKGPKMVLVKHLHSLSSDSFSMMLATVDGVYLAQRPHLEFAKQPVGVGDLITGLFTAGLTKGWEPKKAFEHAHNAAFGVLRVTQESQTWELQTIKAQDEFVNPSSDYAVQKVG
ncbi:pyridoxal kinase PdxY [Vibrio superstes]|uniref:Pyridoxal kinase PdxY n=1 Tax=Vibrio superstes NBRC 103154 TaxID=1219062 RepID=A0A511QL66_9VIBR|nr:pyridoxal kinase PdxY [Vibrio superstes]GEM77756.1 pyridoxal kinase PdxY [Vibrio superstes NBRC 103154]